MTNRFKQPAKAAALAVFVLAGSATVVSAHSVKACMWAVIEFCGTDQACRASGFAGCQGNAHQHPGSPPPEAPDPAFSADPGHTFNKGKNFKMR